MARKIMGVTNYVDRKAAKEENLNLLRPRTLQRVQEDARMWRNAMSQKEHKRSYTKTGVRHSVLMELEYWDPTTMVPVDCMYLLFLGLLQYHVQTVLGMDSAGNRNPKVTDTMAKQLEDARQMLSQHTSPELVDLKTLKVDVLKILCEEMGIGVDQYKEPRKEDLIASLKVRWILVLPWHVSSSVRALRCPFLRGGHHVSRTSSVRELYKRLHRSIQVSKHHLQWVSLRVI